MKLIARKALRYAGKSLVAGDEFEASARDARLLKAIGKAADSFDTAEPELTAPADDNKPAKRGGYKTRRLTAKG